MTRMASKYTVFSPLKTIFTRTFVHTKEFSTYAEWICGRLKSDSGNMIRLGALINVSWNVDSLYCSVYKFVHSLYDLRCVCVMHTTNINVTVTYNTYIARVQRREHVHIL